jgi:hypothetical protein
MSTHAEHALTFFSACSACFNSDASSSDTNSSSDDRKSNSKDDSKNMTIQTAGTQATALMKATAEPPTQ